MYYDVTEPTVLQSLMHQSLQHRKKTYINSRQSLKCIQIRTQRTLCIHRIL